MVPHDSHDLPQLYAITSFELPFALPFNMLPFVAVIDALFKSAGFGFV